MEVRLDGAFADLQRARDLGDRELVDVEQGHGDALLTRQLSEDRGQLRIEATLLDRLDLRLAGEAFEGSTLAALATMVVAQTVDGDTTDPADRVVVVLDAA